ncbi:hypothetical protein [Sabulicella glaciei]|uniref:Uncharacterized protein n=1 Tax=Sabulicella glaciei TaxID=2984948 RepID=A0ABT3NR83_9PROT|nr:hypothetical protein [Roseococcus sp. MDT2-1-1]MCW8084667.1 hypothetical protein [Roseococcus sp. MDT2-1-1]
MTLEARMNEDVLSLLWMESNGPASDPGPAALRLLAPRGMRAVLETGGSGPSLQIRIPASSLAD